ncbi:MAG TPA: bifunctional precorrin-2 dehydrogenase/sirohydrochlorin ferrochelatase [Phototrophicaceae bacterium]|nr:bifunctional precorrin-2 dehydrogenase/sirohydrochlorin ferrochelatase [Phototrophicaceae bacterium]
MADYPILLKLNGQRVVVIGGGKVAARKVLDLIAAGAVITLISPALHGDLMSVAQWIDVRLTRYAPGMLADLRPFLVFAATDSREVNRQIADEARDLGVLVNVTDNGSASDFTSMAAIQRDLITIAISTGGASPALSAHLREQLEAVIGEEYTTLARWLGDLRPLVQEKVKLEARRRELWQAIIASPALDHLRSGDEVGARAIIDALVQQAINDHS